jgi:hypothetical protein
MIFYSQRLEVQAFGFYDVVCHFLSFYYPVCQNLGNIGLHRKKAEDRRKVKFEKKITACELAAWLGYHVPTHSSLSDQEMHLGVYHKFTIKKYF